MFLAQFGTKNIFGISIDSNYRYTANSFAHVHLGIENGRERTENVARSRPRILVQYSSVDALSAEFERVARD